MAATGWLVAEVASAKSGPLPAGCVPDRSGLEAPAGRRAAFRLSSGAGRPLVVACVMVEAAPRGTALGLGEARFAASTCGCGPGSFGRAPGAPAWALFGFAGLGWGVGFGSADVGWAGLGFAGLGWGVGFGSADVGWAGLGFAGLGWGVGFGSADVGWAGLGFAGSGFSGLALSSVSLPDFSGLGSSTSGVATLGASTWGFSAFGVSSPFFGSTLDWSSGCPATVVAGTGAWANAVPAPRATASMTVTTQTTPLDLMSPL